MAMELTPSQRELAKTEPRLRFQWAPFQVGTHQHEARPPSQYSMFNRPSGINNWTTHDSTLSIDQATVITQATIYCLITSDQEKKKKRLLELVDNIRRESSDALYDSLTELQIATGKRLLRTYLEEWLKSEGMGGWKDLTEV